MYLYRSWRHAPSFSCGLQDLELPPPATLECIADTSSVGAPSVKVEDPAAATSSAHASSARASSAHISSAPTAERGQTSGADSPASVPAAVETEKASGTDITASKDKDPFAAATRIAVGASPVADGPAAASAAATADVGELPQLVDEQQAIPRGHQDGTCGDAASSVGVDDAAVRSAAIELSEQRQQAAAEGKVATLDSENERSASQTISVAG